MTKSVDKAELIELAEDLGITKENQGMFIQAIREFATVTDEARLSQPATITWRQWEAALKRLDKLEAERERKDTYPKMVPSTSPGWTPNHGFPGVIS